VAQQIEVKPQYGITDEVVEQMLLDSITNAQDDIKIRALVEAKTEAEQLIDTTTAFLNSNGALLSEDEKSQTARAMEELKAALTTEDKDRIHGKITQLNELSRPYAERVMDQAISRAMTGRNVLK
jgi:molecular chaperone HscA